MIATLRYHKYQNIVIADIGEFEISPMTSVAGEIGVFKNIKRIKYQ